jgi:hypothetical protein
MQAPSGPRLHRQQRVSRLRNLSFGVNRKAHSTARKPRNQCRVTAKIPYARKPLQKRSQANHDHATSDAINRAAALLHLYPHLSYLHPHKPSQ